MHKFGAFGKESMSQNSNNGNMNLKPVLYFTLRPETDDHLIPNTVKSTCIKRDLVQSKAVYEIINTCNKDVYLFFYLFLFIEFLFCTKFGQYIAFCPIPNVTRTRIKLKP